MVEENNGHGYSVLALLTSSTITTQDRNRASICHAVSIYRTAKCPTRLRERLAFGRVKTGVGLF